MNKVHSTKSMLFITMFMRTQQTMKALIRISKLSNVATSHSILTSLQITEKPETH